MGSRSFRFVDLFAGLGGFHVALDRLGGQAVFAAEWEPGLNALYQTNFGIKPWGDVNELNSPALIDASIPDHEVLAAGFPCQPFSKAGEQLGFEHTLQGQLFFKVLDILEVKKPGYVILENVPNILRHRKGQTLIEITKHLESLGYAIDYHRFSPHEFGIPQIRDRAYFVASRDGLDRFEWPQVTGDKTDILTVLSSNPRVRRQIPEQTLRAVDMWDDFLRRSPSSTKLPSFPLWAMEFGADYPFETATPAALWDERGPRALDGYHGSFARSLRGLTRKQQFDLLPSHARRADEYVFPHWKQTFIRQNRDFFWENHVWIRPWLDKWRPWDMPSSFQKFEWNAQGGVREIDRYVLQVRASGIRVKRTHTAPSLIAMTHTQVPILGAKLAGGKRRYMTPEECAQLQSLEGIQLPATDLAAYKALGNAVNADVVWAIADRLLPLDLREASHTEISVA